MFNFRKRSIKVQMGTFVAFIIIVIISVVYIYYSDTSNAALERINQLNQEVVAQVIKNSDDYCQKLVRISNNIAYNRMVQIFLLEKNDFEKIKMSNNINDLTLSITDMNPDILNIRIVNVDNNLYDELEILQSSKDKHIKNWFSSTTDLLKSYNNENNSLFMVTDVYDMEGSTSNNLIGKVMITFRSMAICPSLVGKNLDDNMQLLMVDRNGNIFSQNTSRAMDIWKQVKNKSFNPDLDNEEVVLNGVTYNVGIYKLDHIEGKLVYITSPVDTFEVYNKHKYKALAILGAALFLLLIPFVLIILNIIIPVRKFITYMKALSGGNIKLLDKSLNILGYAEINEMVKEFNRMMSEIKNLTNRLITTNTRLYEMELAKKQAQISYLQSQINPHFLYNTLESIKGLALINGNNDIWHMVKSLGTIFKYGISRDDFVTLHDEVNIAKEYISIQKIRFEERFDFFFRLTDEALKCKIPRMILQPIIENAIYHGIEPADKDECEIIIEGYLMTQEELVIKISDDGAGMDNETLWELKLKLEGTSEIVKEDTEKSGIGITNVNNRLKMIYGEKFNMQISSNKGCGTEVHLMIPIWRNMYV